MDLETSHTPMTLVTIIKRDHTGRELWQYQGKLLAREPHRVVLEAYFDRDDYPIGDLLLRRGDRFVEIYYDDRWYNIHEIYDRADHHFKAWYCNIAYPAAIEGDEISYQDLALDLLIFPDGRQVVLDEGEFQSLQLDPEIQTQARSALAELQTSFKENQRKESGWDR
jgi:predicted RNA-binding protein associated with RNAse of E/G family